MFDNSSSDDDSDYGPLPLARRSRSDRSSDESPLVPRVRADTSDDDSNNDSTAKSIELERIIYFSTYKCILVTKNKIHKYLVR